MNSLKQKSAVVYVLLFVVLAVGGVGFYLHSQNKWKTYTNAIDVNFSIQYPQTWTYSKEKNGGVELIFQGQEGKIIIAWGNAWEANCTGVDSDISQIINES